MVMIDNLQSDGPELEAPETHARYRLDEALSEWTDAPADQPETPVETAAEQTPAPKLPEASPTEPQGEASASPAVDYSTLRAPELRQHLTAREKDLADARAEIEKARKELAEHRGKVDDYGKREQEALASLGSDDEFSTLHRKVQAAKELGQDPAYYLTDDELRAYDRLSAQRTHAASLLRIADAAIRKGIADDVSTRVEKYGLDPKVVNANPDTGTLLDHAVAVTEKRVAESFKDTIAEKDAEIKTLSDRLLGRSKDPGIAGRSISRERASDFDSSEYDPSRRGRASEQLREALMEPVA